MLNRRSCQNHEDLHDHRKWFTEWFGNSEAKNSGVQRHLFAWKQLLKKFRRKRFRHGIVTEEEKWLPHNNSQGAKTSWKYPSQTSSWITKSNVPSTKIKFGVRWARKNLLKQSQVWNEHWKTNWQNTTKATLFQHWNSFCQNSK